jgi:hypothetical protein
LTVLINPLPRAIPRTSTSAKYFGNFVSTRIITSTQWHGFDKNIHRSTNAAAPEGRVNGLMKYNHKKNLRTDRQSRRGDSEGPACSAPCTAVPTSPPGGVCRYIRLWSMCKLDGKLIRAGRAWDFMGRHGPSSAVSVYVYAFVRMLRRSGTMHGSSSSGPPRSRHSLPTILPARPAVEAAGRPTANQIAARADGWPGSILPLPPSLPPHPTPPLHSHQSSFLGCVK